MRIASQRFISWSGVSIGLGSLPFFVNLLIHFIIGDISYNSVFQINELMYFCIVLTATTMYDLFSLHKHQSSNLSIIIFWFLLTILTLVIAVTLGVSSYYNAVQPVRDIFNQIEFRLIKFGLGLVIFTLIGCIALQIYITTNLEKQDKREE